MRCGQCQASVAERDEGSPGARWVRHVPTAPFAARSPVCARPSAAARRNSKSARRGHRLKRCRPGALAHRGGPLGTALPGCRSQRGGRARRCCGWGRTVGRSRTCSAPASGRASSTRAGRLSYERGQILSGPWAPARQGLVTPVRFVVMAADLRQEAALPECLSAFPVLPPRALPLRPVRSLPPRRAPVAPYALVQGGLLTRPASGRPEVCLLGRWKTVLPRRLACPCTAN